MRHLDSPPRAVMTALMAASLAAFPVALATGCGDDSTEDTGVDEPNEPAPDAFLDGKTLVMEGADIPTHPNGFDENLNLGQATQCYHRTEIAIMAGTWSVTTDLGELRDAPMQGDVGTCDRAVRGTQLVFDSTTVLIGNVQGNGDCFDVTVTYPNFVQDGRASIDRDANTVAMELFFESQAIGQRCGDGGVGSGGITLSGEGFVGDAVQIYRIQ